MPTVSESRKAGLMKLQTPSDVDVKYSASKWDYVSASPEGAYAADCPLGFDIAAKFGRDYYSNWMHGQILALFGSSSNRDKGVADGIKLFATSFANEVRGFKLTELMLFFSRYKAGKYDNSFASFDARRIGNAFFKEFLPQRNHELDRIYRKKAQEEREANQFTPPEGYTSLSWYQELQRRAAGGDREAAEYITKTIKPKNQ